MMRRRRQDIARSITLVLLGACLGGGVGRAAQGAAACSQERLDRFIQRAQAGDGTGIGEGRSLSLCRGLSAEAVQWLAFLLAHAGDRAQSVKTDETSTVLPSRQGPSSAAVIARARGGDYRELWAKVDGAAKGYGTDPEALLALGRVLARKSFFNRSRDMYVTYLRLKPQDYRAEAEYLYTFVWEKDAAGAEARLRAAARRPMPAGLQEAVERGLVLLQTRGSGGSTRPTAPAPATTAVPAATNPLPALSVDKGTVVGTVSGSSTKLLFHRRSVQAAYHGLFEARLAAHRLRYAALEDGELAGTEAELGFGAALGNVRFGAHGGYFSPGEGRYFGDVGVDLAWTSNLRFRAGADRRPLALERALPDDSIAMMRDGVRYGVDYARYLTVDASLLKEGDYAAYEHHTLVARLPLRGDATQPQGVIGPAEWFAVRLPLSLEVRPRPNPNYDAPARSETLGLGFEWERRLTPRLTGAASADYQLARVVGRGNERQRRDIPYAVGAMRVELEATKRIMLSLGARAAWADDESWLYAQALGTSVELAVAQRLR